jgi:hypothetical protein
MSLYSSPVPAAHGPAIRTANVGADSAEIFVLAADNSVTDYAIEWTRTNLRFRAAVAVQNRNQARDLDSVLATLGRVHYSTG